MELKDNGKIEIDNGKKKTIKCHRFNCKIIKRELMVHEDIDNKNYTSISDYKTGYKLFSLRKKVGIVKPLDIEERLKQFIKHFTLEGITEEFKKIENK